MTRSPRRVARALACVAVLLAGCMPVACGGAEPTDGAAALVTRAFDEPATAVRSGRLDLRLRIDPDGVLGIGGPIELALAGPFAAPTARGELPRFDVDVVATLAGRPYDAGVSSTGERAFVRLDGRPYEVDRGELRELRAGLRAADAPATGLRALGFEPPRWLLAPRSRGRARIDREPTVRIGGRLAVVALLEDLDRLLTRAGGPLAPGAAVLLTPELRRQIAAATTRATADAWVGERDGVVRRIAARIDFDFNGETPIPGLDGAQLRLRLALHDINAPIPAIHAPRGARPIETLTGGGIGTFLRGLETALTDRSSGFPGGAILRCIRDADGRTAPLVRCLSGASG